jgi:hypothetical protein
MNIAGVAQAIVRVQTGKSLRAPVAMKGTRMVTVERRQVEKLGSA